MKILETKNLAIPEIKVIRFARFNDERGYFTETFRKSDFNTLPFLKEILFLQVNESCSKPNVMRGLHFQWNPYVGKLIRTFQGHMVDMVLDIRKNSSTYGKIIAYNMPSKPDFNYGEWIWIPPGFAHGNFFLEATVIEYFCTGEYNPHCEAGIMPLSKDIDWSICDVAMKKQFDLVVKNGVFLSKKDKEGLSLTQWAADPRSKFFSI